MFDAYFDSQTSALRQTFRPLGLSVVAHVALFVLILSVPLASIKELPPPSLLVEIFEATPPPPPPPPPASTKKSETTKPKVEPTEPKPDEMVEPEEVPEKLPEVEENAQDQDEEEDKGVVGGVEGGEEGGVVGGVLGGAFGDRPPKVLVKSQKKISGRAPVFPASAKAQGLSSTIAVRICISAVGQVTSVKILRGAPAFNAAVKKAVKTWKYEPYMAGRTPMPACFPVYFNFNLKH